MSDLVSSELFNKKERLTEKEINQLFDFVSRDHLFKALKLTKNEFLQNFESIKNIYLNNQKCESLGNFSCYSKNFIHIALIRDVQTNKLKMVAIECPKSIYNKRLVKIRKNYLFHNFTDELFHEKLIDYRTDNLVMKTIRNNMKPLIVELLKIKKNNFNLGYGYYISGPMGIGKTHIMIAFCNECAFHGKSIAFCFMPDLVYEIKNSFGNDKKLNSLMNILISCDILVLDDLLAEYTNQWFYNEYLIIILNRRLQSKKTTYFISNTPFSFLKSSFDKFKLGSNGLRLFERIKGLIGNKNIIDIQNAVNIRDNQLENNGVTNNK